MKPPPRTARRGGAKVISLAETRRKIFRELEEYLAPEPRDVLDRVRAGTSLRSLARERGVKIEEVKALYETALVALSVAMFFAGAKLEEVMEQTRLRKREALMLRRIYRWTFERTS